MPPTNRHTDDRPVFPGVSGTKIGEAAGYHNLPTNPLILQVRVKRRHATFGLPACRPGADLPWRVAELTAAAKVHAWLYSETP